MSSNKLFLEYLRDYLSIYYPTAYDKYNILKEHLNLRLHFLIENITISENNKKDINSFFIKIVKGKNKGLIGNIIKQTKCYYFIDIKETVVKVKKKNTSIII